MSQTEINQTYTQKNGMTYTLLDQAKEHWGRVNKPDYIYLRKPRRKNVWIEKGTIKSISYFTEKEVEKAFPKNYKTEVITWKDHILCSRCDKEYPSKPNQCECEGKQFIKQFSFKAKIVEEKVLIPNGYSFSQIYPPRAKKVKAKVKAKAIAFTDYLKTKDSTKVLLADVKFQFALLKISNIRLATIVDGVCDIYSEQNLPDDFRVHVDKLVRKSKDFAIETDYEEIETVRQATFDEKEFISNLA